MTVATALPTVGTGLPGRLPVGWRRRRGLFVAGDWAGPTGWLPDACLADCGALLADAAFR